MLRVWSAIAISALLLLSWSLTRALMPARERGVFPINPPTPFLHFKPAGISRGKVLVVHGLDASKDFMQLFSGALVDGGFEVYAIDLPGHGDSTAAFTATLARDAVVRTLDFVGDIDIVVGHSLGGGLLVDIASDRPFRRMVLLSPAPTPIDQTDYRNTLVVTGTLDIPAINSFIPRLEGAEWWRVRWSFHSSAPFDTKTTRNIVGWLGGTIGNVHATARLRWSLLALISAVGLGIVLLPKASHDKTVQTTAGMPDIIARFVLAGTGAAIILRLFPLTRWLHLFATDYLIGMIFVIGLILCATRKGKARPKEMSRISPLVGILAAAYAVFVVGFFAAADLAHFSLSDGRWWRFPLIAVAGFPLFYFDEIELRPLSRLKTAWIGLITRCLIAVSIMMGAFTLNRGNAFIVLITHILIIFWLGLWILAGVVHKRTGSPLAAAVFACVVQAWIFAAWFVIV